MAVFKNNYGLPTKCLVCLIGFLSFDVYPGPDGGNVVGGAGSISQNGNTTTINQNTDLMAIDWKSFEDEFGHTTKHIWRSAYSIVYPQ